MASLGFELLDRHVVGGRADDLATPTLTFARLLELSAALGAGLAVLGARAGQHVGVQVDGDDRVVAICACIRVGAVPAAVGDVVVEPGDDGPQVRTPDDVLPLDLVRRAGSGDPATALAGDADGYRDTVRALVADVVDPLLAGSTVR